MGKKKTTIVAELLQPVVTDEAATEVKAAEAKVEAPKAEAAAEVKAPKVEENEKLPDPPVNNAREVSITELLEIIKGTKVDDLKYTITLDAEELKTAQEAVGFLAKIFRA